MSSPSSSLAISWALSTISGYGIYGLQIVMQFLRRGGEQVVLTQAPAVTVAPPLVQAKLDPIYDLARKLHAFRQQNPEELLSFNHAALHGCSTNFAGFAGQDKIWGKPNVGCCAIEQLVCDDQGRKIAGNYDMFIAISKWNYDFLKSLDLGPTHLCYQGIDASLFHPGPRTGLYKNRFVIFSGGKFEFRKGQDIVIEAFKRFRARHPEALLVACWQNLNKPEAEAFAMAGYCKTMPQPAPEYGLQFTPWLLSQGLPAGSFIDLPFTHNLLMPSVLRECDAAVFPNRCEGGTNLVAMETMACGVPTYVASNTGQKDLIDLIGCGGFIKQGAVHPSPGMQTVQDWGESDPDEVVEALERIYTQRAETKQKADAAAEKVKLFEWGPLNEKLLSIVCDGKANA